MPKKMKRLKRLKPGKPYRQLWRIVDGAVRDCLLHHPDYLTAYGHARHRARLSLNKRVVGAVLGYAGHCSARAQGRSGGP